MKPEHPEMQSLQRADRGARPPDRTRSRSDRFGSKQHLLADYRAAASAERALQARVRALKGDVLNLRGRSIQYTILQREVDTNRSLYDALLQRYKEIGVAGGVGIAPVSIVDRADPPGLPFKPNLFLNLLTRPRPRPCRRHCRRGRLEFLNDTIKSREDVRQKLRLPCLGIVPRTPAKDTFVEDLRIPTSMVSEAYSAIVAALRFSTEAGHAQGLAGHQHPIGRGQVVNRAGARAEFRAARKSRCC